MLDTLSSTLALNSCIKNLLFMRGFLNPYAQNTLITISYKILNTIKKEKAQISRHKRDLSFLTFLKSIMRTKNKYDIHPKSKKLLLG
ncbi:hypothetical protein B1B01_08775 [Priestia filamentosa]|nr:hypothetical protein B1B01_08775 [Priestia filamentosa]